MTTYTLKRTSSGRIFTSADKRVSAHVTRNYATVYFAPLYEPANYVVRSALSPAETRAFTDAPNDVLGDLVNWLAEGTDAEFYRAAAIREGAQLRRDIARLEAELELKRARLAQTEMWI